jgi:hypothetical protein
MSSIRLLFLHRHWSPVCSSQSSFDHTVYCFSGGCARFSAIIVTSRVSSLIGWQNDVKQLSQQVDKPGRICCSEMQGESVMGALVHLWKVVY